MDQNPFRPETAGHVIAAVILKINGEFDKQTVLEQSIAALAQTNLQVKVEGKVGTVIGLLKKKGLIKSLGKNKYAH